MAANKRRPRALVVDDEPDICELIALTLERLDVEARVAGDLASAARALKSTDFELCLTDLRLPDGSGLELVERIAMHYEAVPVAVITAHGDVESAVNALKLGAFDFVSKPVELDALRQLVNTALRLPPPNRSPEGEKDGTSTKILGDSEPMLALRRMIQRVARVQAPVHIYGEAGVGKELVARLIHESGPRADRPFIPVNCGAIPSELMESEFFGHRKGSFTSATSDKPGLFQTAHGGTLFLDEIADLPLHMQVKLLRVIAGKAVRAIGDSREIPVDVRIISATNRQLSGLVSAGQFREDLFYRINVIELQVPPLRDRGEDVLLLTEHILARLARESGISVPGMSADAHTALLNYPFPGNVRELENILERALTLSSAGAIEADDLQIRVESPANGGDLEARLREVAISTIQDALKQTGGNKTKAAQLLGLSLRQLSYRMKTLGMSDHS
ncbi:MAG: sigma-54 dependent transcriptional regulator [Pseudomonadota bacterium]